MRASSFGLLFALLCNASLAQAAEHKAKDESAAADWNRYTAAQYLDARQQWWMAWPKAQRDHDTACVSCHTVLPYAMGRSTLHTGPNAKELSPQETQMIGYITKRVTLWQEVKPFYLTEERGPRKSEESRGSEAVLNALILARYDQPSGSLRPVTKAALANMWALQIGSGDEEGSWDWINFHGAPWESDESHYWGATLGAVAVGMTPQSYRTQSDVQKAIARLRAYLVQDYEKQPLLNRVNLLWASGQVSGLLTPGQRIRLFADIKSHEQADGGWTTATLGPWKRKDGTPLDRASDGYATGLVVYALQQAGVPAASEEVQKGRQWLVANQAADGHWNASSLNKQRDSTADPARFMSDAASAYATLALSSFR